VGGGPPVRAGQKAALHFQPAATLANVGVAPGRPVAWLDERAFAQGLQRAPGPTAALLLPPDGWGTTPYPCEASHRLKTLPVLPIPKDTLKRWKRRNKQESSIITTNLCIRALAKAQERGRKSACLRMQKSAGSFQAITSSIQRFDEAGFGGNRFQLGCADGECGPHRLQRRHQRLVAPDFLKESGGGGTAWPCVGARQCNRLNSRRVGSRTALSNQRLKSAHAPRWRTKAEDLVGLVKSVARWLAAQQGPSTLASKLLKIKGFGEVVIALS